MKAEAWAVWEEDSIGVEAEASVAAEASAAAEAFVAAVVVEAAGAGSGTRRFSTAAHVPGGLRKLPVHPRPPGAFLLQFHEAWREIVFPSAAWWRK
jgi:hypothetical protein